MQPTSLALNQKVINRVMEKFFSVINDYQDLIKISFLSDDMKDKLMGESLPAGFEREGIVIGKDYYGVMKSTSTVLGKTVESEDIQKADDLPDGQLFDSKYGIRLMIEGGSVAAVEILKRKEEQGE